MLSVKVAAAMAGTAIMATVGLAGAAQAAPASPHGCTNRYYYSTWNGHPYFDAKQPVSSWSVTGSAGQPISMSVTTGSTVSTQITKTSGSSVGINAEVISGQAHHDISHSIQNTVTNSVTLNSGQYVVKHHAAIYYGAGGYAYQ